MSIGWFGAVAAFLALAFTGTMSQNPETVRAAYLVKGVTTWWVIVPFALLGLVTRIVSALFTKWGMFRYYWGLMKLVITVLTTLVLLKQRSKLDGPQDDALRLATDADDVRRLIDHPTNQEETVNGRCCLSDVDERISRSVRTNCVI
jgi:hypothetical protein